MAKVQNQYEELDEFVNIANKLCERFPEIFGGINIAKIAAVAIVNKDRDEKKPLFDIKTAVPPMSMFSPKDYVVVVYMSDWGAFADKQKGYLVADALRTISPEGQGKKIPFDLKDHAIMLKTFGVDYMENPSVPDLLKDKVNWRS